ncbi:sugar-binding domain-containing protein [Ohtaekwangia sp.]|uniref:sugar-binding domain-containing protein n=1 Tax=Ohtaekwangia sp. TaxID=2066019 RepID=UPI002FDE573B
MKNIVYILLLYMLLPGADVLAQRQTTLFNDDWKFYKGDVTSGEKLATSDQAWRTVDLPHDWSIEGPFSDAWASGTGYLPAGIGWYRKSFGLLPGQQNKNIYLYFDGVYKNSEVWINEHYLGKRPNGYASFYYDVTPYLKAKGKNLVAVKVDHTDFADSRWYTGSGINRNVYLIATDPVHIAVWGTVFTTPSVSAEKAVADVQVTVKNNTLQSSDTRIVVTLQDGNGKIVATSEAKATAAHGKTTDLHVSMAINKPSLWSAEKPALYTLHTTLYAGSKAVDDVTERVGFRTFRFDANKGFFLNDVNLKLKGVCIHDDAGALGSAVPKDVWARRLRALKAGGCNSIRMSHNPHQDYLYDLCDELGFIVQDEAFDEWEIGKNKWIKGWNIGTPGKDGYHTYFAEWADRDLRDMILRDRNHACVLMWSIGNEIDYPNDPYSHEVLNTGRNPQIYGRGYEAGNPPASRLGEIARHLVQVVKQTDTTRPVTAALAGVVMSNYTSFPDALDIVGYNYQEYRYAEDHRQYPNRIIYGSENSRSYNAWAVVDSTEYISAQYLWTGIDFMGEAHVWPLRSSGVGLLDLAGFEKPEYYYRKSLWSNDPVVYLAARKLPAERRRAMVGGDIQSHWNWNGTDSLQVLCFTNAGEAELFVNGKSLGKRKRTQQDQQIIHWSVRYEPGEVTVQAYNNGVAGGKYTLVTSGEATSLAVNTDRKDLPANRDNVAHVSISAIDMRGNINYQAAQEVEISIEGPGKLIGLESGDLASHEDYKASKRKLYQGKLLAYIQAVKPGRIKVTVNAVGLKSSTLELNATEQR